MAWQGLWPTARLMAGIIMWVFMLRVANIAWGMVPPSSLGAEFRPVAELLKFLWRRPPSPEPAWVQPALELPHAASSPLGALIIAGVAVVFDLLRIDEADPW